MNDIVEYVSVKSSVGPYEIKEKGSRFISYSKPVSEKTEAEAILAEIRKKYFDSTHVCFGYRIGEGEEKELRYSDDGEPSGTAGLPIINEIRGMELFNVLVIVIRYYGGTKLGTGGLFRAYRDSAKLSLDNSQVHKKIIKTTRTVLIPYDFMGELMRIVNKYALTILDKKYDNNGISVELSIPVKNLNIVRNTIINISKGKVDF